VAKKSKARAFLDKLIGNPMTLGGFLRSHREDEGLSLTAMAQELGTSRRRLRKVELDQSAANIPVAIQWAPRLGYVDELFVQLALQSRIDAAGLELRVTLESTERRRDDFVR
jgi:plasmid maintenance system antidote protein VapI